MSGDGDVSRALVGDRIAVHIDGMICPREDVDHCRIGKMSRALLVMLFS